MPTRKLLLLLAIFLGLLAFVVLFERHQPTSEEAAKARKRFLDFKTEDVTGLLVERPDLPKIELTRKANRWTLVSEPGGPGDAVTIDALVSDLNRLELVGEVRTSFDPKDFGLDAPKAKVTLTFKGGGKRSVHFGAAIPGTDATAAAEGNRFGGVKFAPMATLAKPLDDFRSKALLEVPTNEVTRVTVVKGPNKVVLVREGEPEKGSGDWRIEAPVKDLANRTFVQQLLADLTAARVSEFPSVPPSDLAKIGLNPPAAVVTLQKGAEIVSTVALGAAKAEATGKVYARRDNLVVVVDDRIQEDLNKEFTAFRETKVLPVDPWTVVRVSFEAQGQRVGAEKVEGEWRSGGKVVGSALPEDLVERIGRAEARAFVARKDYVARGILGPKDKKPLPIATLEVTREKETAPRTAVFYAAALLSGAKVVAVEVSDRAEALLVDRAVLDDLNGLATKLKAAATAAPTPVPARKAPTPGVARPVPTGDQALPK